uniref:Aminoalcoholphosphotransferase n=1 Tax=Aegilops tauschii subsp. strangulata TaxID=200361 RepID=A0A453R2L2_AEGTS
RLEYPTTPRHRIPTSLSASPISPRQAKPTNWVTPHRIAIQRPLESLPSRALPNPLRRPSEPPPAAAAAAAPEMVYIGAHGVETLKRYRYSGQDHSVVAKYVLQPFWSRCVTLFPLWMPPNMITLMGFMFLLTSSLLSYIYSPHLDTAPPRWVHLAHGILLFLYQTFDAVDGKQARRTSSSSPLGELFDHGCDALACAFEALALGSTLMCGRLTFCYWVVAAVPFYLATWEHYFTNTLILPVINGPTEGLMLIYVSHLFTFFTGAEWWAQDFRKSLPLISLVPLPFVPEIPLYVIVLILMIMFAVIPTVGSNIGNVQKVVDARKGSMELALAMLLPFIALLAGVAVWVLSLSFRYHEEPATSACDWNWFCFWIFGWKDDTCSFV